MMHISIMRDMHHFVWPRVAYGSPERRELRNLVQVRVAVDNHRALHNVLSPPPILHDDEVSELNELLSSPGRLPARGKFRSILAMVSYFDNKVQNGPHDEVTERALYYRDHLTAQLGMFATENAYSYEDGRQLHLPKRPCFPVYQRELLATYG